MYSFTVPALAEEPPGTFYQVAVGHEEWETKKRDKEDKQSPGLDMAGSVGETHDTNREGTHDSQAIDTTVGRTNYFTHKNYDREGLARYKETNTKSCQDVNRKLASGSRDQVKKYHPKQSQDKV